MSDNITDGIRRFVTTNFYVPDPAQLDDQVSLLESGIVDSTGLLEIIGFLESTYGVKVDDGDILPENFDGIARIADYVTRKRERAA